MRQVELHDEQHLILVLVVLIIDEGLVGLVVLVVRYDDRDEHEFQCLHHMLQLEQLHRHEVLVGFHFDELTLVVADHEGSPE